MKLLPSSSSTLISNNHCTFLYRHEVGLHFAELVDVDAGEQDAEDEHAERQDVAAGHQPVNHRDGHQGCSI